MQLLNVLGLFAVATVVSARPMPQIGGDAQACYSILNNVDNGTGYATENVEDNVADVISGQHTGSDSEGGNNPSGGAGQAPAGGAGAGAGGPGAGGPGPHRRELELIARQLNKVVAGLGNLGEATKTSTIVNPIVNAGDEIDTVGTNGQGQIGENIGNIEDPGLPEIANELTDFNP